MGVVPYNSRCLALAATAVLWAGCGGGSKGNIAQPTPNKTVAGGVGGTTTGLDAGAGETNCKSKDQCPNAASDISASFAPSGALLGFVGEPVAWEFHGVDRDTANADQQSSVRKIMVLLDKVPEGSTITPAPGQGDLSNVAKVNWTPDKEQKGKLDIILRDFERCLVNESADRCNKYAYLQAYDTKFKDVAWEVVDKEKIQSQIDEGATATADGASTGTATNVVNVSNPNCGPPPTTSSDITGKLLGSFIGVLQNPSGLSSIAPSLLGGLTGGGSTATANPTSC